MIKSIAVFCGSKSGNDPLFAEHAIMLGKMMAEKGITLIYGGGGKGLMMNVADAVLNNGGNVTGIIPELLLEWEQHHTGLTDLQVVPDMHSRKKLLFSLADAAVVLPGGNGTLDEMFEMLTWNTLKIHDKKIFIMNTNGFYNHLLAHMQQMLASGFLYDPIEKRVVVINHPDEILSQLSQ
jgi:uncharacterized protein (TIGR00730 family)